MKQWLRNARESAHDGIPLASHGLQTTEGEVDYWTPPPQQPATAVCLAGQLRSFFEPLVQIGFKRNLHKVGHEYYLSVDQPVSHRASHLSFGPLVGVRALDSGPKRRAQLSSCPARSYDARGLLPMVGRYIFCYQAMTVRETKQHFQYDFVLRARPDHLFYERVPPCLQLLPDTEPINLQLWDDQLAIGRRELARTILLVPMRLYRICWPDWPSVCSTLQEQQLRGRRELACTAESKKAAKCTTKLKGLSHTG
mmetsp:Transcript_1599/g.2613  ORF Transcript_1599/g.2613 Transcript_1599/m.2613 type:complete len:253 (+) Transcript_1599:76-834(+)